MKKHLLLSVESTSSLWITDTMMTRQNHFSEVFCGCERLFSPPPEVTRHFKHRHRTAAVTAADPSDLLLVLPSPWALKAEMFLRLKRSEMKQPDLTPLQ